MTKLFSILLVLLCFPFFIYSQEIKNPKTIPTISYCDVVRNPNLYNEKEIKISGEYYVAFELSGMFSPACRENSSLIYLEWKNYQSCGDKKTVDTLKNRFRGIENNNLEGVFVGKFFIKEGLSGFGHMNTKPYKLEVSCVEKAELLPKEFDGCSRVDKTSPFHYLEYLKTEYGIKPNYKISSKKKRKGQIVWLSLVNNSSCPISIPIISNKTEVLQNNTDALVVYKLDNRIITSRSIIVQKNQKESRFITEKQPVYTTLQSGNSITFGVPVQYFKKRWNISVPFKHSNKKTPEHYEPFYFSWQKLPKEN
jgi:hypothetical protein